MGGQKKWTWEVSNRGDKPDDLSLRSTGPILDLLALGNCPEASRQLLLDLVLWIALFRQ